MAAGLFGGSIKGQQFAVDQLVVVLVADVSENVQNVFMVEEGVLEFAQDGAEVAVQLITDLVLAASKHLVEAVDGALALLPDMSGDLVKLQ